MSPGAVLRAPCRLFRRALRDVSVGVCLLCFGSGGLVILAREWAALTRGKVAAMARLVGVEGLTILAQPVLRRVEQMVVRPGDARECNKSGAGDDQDTRLSHGLVLSATAQMTHRLFNVPTNSERRSRQPASRRFRHYPVTRAWEAALTAR